MKIKHKKIILVINILIILIITAGCSSVVRELESESIYIKKLDSNRNKLHEISFQILENEDGSLAGLLTSPFIYGAEFTGDIKENENGDILFYIEEYRTFCNWPNGWTEIISEATGQILFEYKTLNTGSNNESYYTANITYELEVWDIKSGGIRYFDDFYLDDKGLSKIKDRSARVTAIVDFLKIQDFPGYFGHITKDTSYGPEFHDTIEDFLFDDNTQYPEHLLDLKEYGTILRDFEEAHGLIFIQYNMDYFLNDSLPGAEFLLNNNQ
jgi:hypothetical protein